MKILLVKGDFEVARSVRGALTNRGHNVEIVGDGAVGLTAALSISFDAIILDRILPKLDGLSVLCALRRVGRTTPVIMLSRLESIDDRIECLEAGADDYLVNPAYTTELEARLRAICRRVSPLNFNELLRYRKISVDLANRKVLYDGREVRLYTIEFKILVALIAAEGDILTPSMLLKQVWGPNITTRTNLVQAGVCHLRRSLREVSRKEFIETVRGCGYRMR